MFINSEETRLKSRTTKNIKKKLSDKSPSLYQISQLTLRTIALLNLAKKYSYKDLEEYLRVL